MTLRPPNFCDSCKRLRSDYRRGQVCSAFPEGIPAEILAGFDHRQPFPGDGGVRFVRDPDKPLPPGAAEHVEPQQPVFIDKPTPIRHQTEAELRATAQKMIDRLGNHPER